MTITSADLYTAVNARTGRTGDHDTELKAILHDLAIRGVEIRAEDTQALTTGTRNYTVPTSAKRVILIVPVDSSSLEGDPLTQKTWEEYKWLRSQNAGNGRPLYFTTENGVIYLDPPPNATTYPNMKITSVKYHADGVTTISWNDRMREALIEGVCWKVLLGLDLGGSNIGAPHKTEYELEIEKLLIAQSAEHKAQVRYSDI